MNKREKRDAVMLLIALAMSAALMVWLTFTAPSDADAAIYDFAYEQGLPLRIYPKSLVALLKRNPETEEFVRNYPHRQELEIDLSDLDLTQGVPLLMQWDKRWGYMEYGSDMVAITGCGPVCLAMAGYYLTGDERFYPDRVVSFALENGYAAPGNGSKWTLISQGAKDLGLRVKELPLEEKKIAAYLASGAPIIAVMGPGDFTASGHFIVLTGYENGWLSVNDPNSYANSGRRWEYEAIKDQFRNLWVIQNGTEG